MTNAQENVEQSPIDISKIAKISADDNGQGAEALGETKQYVSFSIGKEEYCVDIIFVREIKGWVPVTPLPNAPEFMLGVLNLRGVIVPIFDMRCRFGMGETQTSSLHVMIIVAVADRVMGILVDAVSDILTVGSNDVLNVPDLDQGGNRKFLSGLITHGDKMVAVLSLDKLFDINLIVEQLNA